MDTDQLIRSLAADNNQAARPVGLILALALMAAMPMSTAILIMGLGIRPDVMEAMRNPFFDLKFIVTGTLAAVAVTLSLHLSRPEASAHGWLWLLALPLAILIAGIAAEMTMPQRAPMLTRWIGSNSRICLVAIPVMSLPLLVAALASLRRGAPAHPALSGAIAGLVSAGFAATLYAAHCPDDSPLFVATWYTLASLIVAAAGAAIGTRVLRY